MENDSTLTPEEIQQKIDKFLEAHSKFLSIYHDRFGLPIDVILNVLSSVLVNICLSCNVSQKNLINNIKILFKNMEK